VLAKRHDGSTFPCQLTVGESRAADGRRVFTGYLRDLSSIRAVEARLRTTQEELLQMGRLVTVGQIGSQLSHELNQPLGAIANYVGAVRQMLGTAPPEKLDEILGKVQAQLARATSVLQHLRSFVATSSGARQHININKVIEQSLALAMVGPRFERARVETDLAANLSSVPMDTTQIQQVIVNLFNNALEAHGENEHAHVAIRSYREGNHVVVDIADRGRGLDPAIRERLFAPFNTTKPRGLGLGLSICRSIIADHRGTMTALPNGERGTVFRFTLPIDDDTQS
jgi:two-component system sensor kinase FixL